MPADVEESSRDESILEDVYRWIDSIPLSRPKKNIGRDFSDCVLVAETIHHYKPNLISLHNFPATSSFKQKVLNWETLNMKVLRKFGLKLSSADIDQVASATPGAIERFLDRLRKRLVVLHSRPETHVVQPILAEMAPVSTPEDSSDVITKLQEQVRTLTERNLKLEQLIQLKEKKIQVLLSRSFNYASSK